MPQPTPTYTLTDTLHGAEIEIAELLAKLESGEVTPDDIIREAQAACRACDVALSTHATQSNK